MDQVRPTGSRRGTRTLAAVAVLASVAVVWLLRLTFTWADRSVVVLALLAVLTMVGMGVDWLIVRFGSPLWRLLRSLVKTAAPALARDPEVDRIRGRYPRATAWLGRRFTLSAWNGLYLTVTVFLAVYFLSGFTELAVNVGLARAITHYDPQLYALVRAFRSDVLTRIFYMVTLFGDVAAFVPLSLIVTTLLVMWAKRREATLFAVTVGVGYAIGEVMKIISGRARPPVELALIAQPKNASFPSGHALAVAIFAITISFILIRMTPRLRQRLTIIGVAIVACVLVGLSRVYLGVHWPSDVLGSWLLAFGWCSITCGTFAILERYGRPAPAWRPWFGDRTRWLVTSLVTKAAVLLVSIAAISDPLLATITTPLPTVGWKPALTSSGDPAPSAADVAALPRFSEKLDGSHQEPIGMIYIGTDKQLTDAFTAAGWFVADAVSLRSLVKVSAAAVANRPYKTGPVTPTFLDGNVQDIAFEKEGPKASARERHHTRFWKTRFTFRGAPVWVATASYDSRLEIGSAIPVPTHHIDPDIDAERDFIVSQLVGQGVRHVGDVRVSDPTSGTDAQGDTFFTQGMAAILMPAK